MAAIGGFRSNLSITRKTDRNLEAFPRVFCFPKSCINENGCNTCHGNLGQVIERSSNEYKPCNRKISFQGCEGITTTYLTQQKNTILGHYEKYPAESYEF